MPGKHCFLLLLLQLIWQIDISLAQRSPYSLQAAVDELHRREAAKYPLNAPPSQQHYFNGGLGEQDYWDDDYNFLANMNKNNNNNNNDAKLLNNRHRLNKALAKYLERENYDADHGGLSLGPFGGWEFDEDSNKINPSYADDKRKRSSTFRERDNKYDVGAPSSVFRERESQVINGADRSGLTEQFLREIEDTQEHEREERYKDALRHLWEKYQQQENEIEGDLFEEKKKRLRTPPYYMLMQKKRSAYPVLPWLPYAERKKRFPVAKRAAKRSTNDVINLVREDKKKRSIEDQTRPTSTNAPNTVSTAMSDMRLETPTKHSNGTETTTRSTAGTAVPANEVHQNNGHAGHHEHSQKQHKHRKRSGDHHSHESHEHEEDDSEEHDSHEEDEGEEEDDHEDFEDEEEEQQKKKRDLDNKKRAAEEAPKLEQQHKSAEMIMRRRKKSIEWSKYFGIDRKKKSEAMMKKRSATERNTEIDEEKKKRELDPEKLENMDKKLQSIEDFIIDETIKYTGAHEGIASPDEIRRLKDHVLSRLATAYSLEKMRRALEKLRQSVDNENHLLRNVVESESNSEDNDAFENQKRTSVKKETVQQNLHDAAVSEKPKEQNSNAIMSHKHASDDDVDEDEEENKKRKKKRGYLRYPELPNDFSDFEEELGAGNYESLNDAYLGNKNYIFGSNQCPLIESMAERCRGVDLLSGDINQELLPICGVHQICYLCGTSQIACDYQYLAEADSICGNSNDCQAAARSVLMILRGSPGPQVGPRECLKNPCLYSAMREIGL